MQAGEIQAHRAPDPAPIGEPAPEQGERSTPGPAHPVPQDEPVPDHKPS